MSKKTSQTSHSNTSSTASTVASGATPAAPPSDGFFLLNEKTLYGPYSKKEIDFLRQRGLMAQFTWLWDDKSKSWKSAKDMPPLEKLKHTQKTKKSTKIRALLFNKKMAVSGWISQLNLDGALVLSNDPRSMPPFTLRQKLQVNLILEGSAQSILADATLHQCEHSDGKWQYQIRWQSLPKELTQLIEIILPLPKGK